MRVGYKDRPFKYQQTEDGHWACWDTRLGIGAVAPTRDQVYDRVCALVLEHLKAMSDDEFDAHLAGCEVHYVDELGNSVPGPDEGTAASG